MRVNRYAALAVAVSSTVAVILTVAVISTVAVSTTARAQAPAQVTVDETPMSVSVGGTPVALEALMEHARRNAPSLALAEAQVALSDADFGRAEPLAPGNASVLAGLGARFQGAETDLNALVQVLQPIEIAGQRPLRFAVARAARRTRERHLDGAREHVHHQIHAGYHAALAARRQAEVARRLAYFARELVQVAGRRAATGEASPLAERLAEADAAQARQHEVAAVQAYRDACLALAEVAGWPAASPPEPIGELPTPRSAPALSTLLAVASRHNPDLLLHRAELEEAELRVELAHRDAWPNPELGLRYAYEGAPGGGAPEHVLMGLVRFSIPSFALNQAAVAGSSAERDVAEARRDAMAAVIEIRLERLRSAVDAAAERVVGYGADILPRFEENLTLLRRAFELGEIDVLRVSVALTRFLQVQDEALGAHVDYFTAVSALEAEVGEEIWPDGAAGQ